MFEFMSGAAGRALPGERVSARRMVSAKMAARINGASGRPTAPAKDREMSGSTNASASSAFSNGRKPVRRPSRSSQTSGTAISVRS
jgi:hypothetical protein